MKLDKKVLEELTITIKAEIFAEKNRSKQVIEHKRKTLKKIKIKLNELEKSK